MKRPAQLLKLDETPGAVEEIKKNKKICKKLLTSRSVCGIINTTDEGNTLTEREVQHNDKRNKDSHNNQRHTVQLQGNKSKSNRQRTLIKSLWLWCRVLSFR